MSKVSMPPVDTDVEKMKMMFEILTLFFNESTNNLAVKLIEKYKTIYKCIERESYYTNFEAKYTFLLRYSTDSHSYYIGFDTTPERSIEILIVKNIDVNWYKYIDTDFLGLSETFQMESDKTNFLKEVFISLPQRIKQLEELDQVDLMIKYINKEL